MRALNKRTGQLEKVYVKALDSNPVGSVMEYLGTTAPKNYLLLDGEIYNINQYPQLANLIKDTFGSYDYFGGNGTTTFGLPDMRGRVPVGVDVRDVDFETIGKIGGSKELQKHTHAYNISLNGTVGADGGRVLVYNGQGQTYNNASGSIQTAGTGDSGNLQPYMAWNFIIKAVNTTPTGAHIVDGYSTSTTDGYSCDYVNGQIENIQSSLTLKHTILQGSVANSGIITYDLSSITGTILFTSIVGYGNTLNNNNVTSIIPEMSLESTLPYFNKIRVNSNQGTTFVNLVVFYY